MNKTQFVTTVVITTLIVVSLGFVAAGSLYSNYAEAHSGYSGMRGHGGHGWHRRGSNPCERMSETHLRIAELVIAEHLDLDDGQQDALQPLIDVAERWRADTVASCQSATFDSVDDGLSTVEAVLSRTAQAAGELRAAYASFEASLNAEQLQHINDMLARHKAMHEGA